MAAQWKRRLRQQSEHADATTFVVGAGASEEFGLPVGEELVDELRARLATDSSEPRNAPRLKALLEAICERTELEMPKLEEAARKLVSGLQFTPSIDDVLDKLQETPGVIPIAKALITDAILEKERNSKLHLDEPPEYDSDHFHFAPLRKTWLAKLFQTLTAACRRPDIPGRLARVSFIVFNYDRCIEEFLRLLFRMISFAADEREADQLVRSTEIIHPYGVVGEVDADGNSTMPFGTKLSPKEIVEYSDSIRTFAEGTQAAVIDDVRDSLRFARRVVFLGFGFQEMNMRLLSSSNDDTLASQKTYATAFRVSKEDAQAAKEQIARALPAHQLVLETYDEKCSAFFDRLSKTLRFETPRYY